MSDQQRSGWGTIVLALVVLGGVLFVGLIGLGFMTYRQKHAALMAIVEQKEAEMEYRAAQARAGAPLTKGPTEVEPLEPERSEYGYKFRAELVTPLPDGSFKILVSGTHKEPTQVESLKFESIEVPNEGNCRVVPPAEPFRETIDFVVHTPPLLTLGIERTTLRIHYALRGTQGSTGFEVRETEDLEVDLRPGSKAK